MTFDDSDLRRVSDIVAERSGYVAEAPGNCDPAQSLSMRLEALMSRLTTEMSELALVKLLPKAKELYEELHPETRHGGTRRKQAAIMATCPSFVTYIAERTGLSTRTVSRRLEQAEALSGLDGEAEKACCGTSLANQLALLVRIAAIPQPKLHQDLVKLLDRQRREGKAQLEKWEKHFRIGDYAERLEPENSADYLDASTDTDADISNPFADPEKSSRSPPAGDVQQALDVLVAHLEHRARLDLIAASAELSRLIERLKLALGPTRASATAKLFGSGSP